MQQYIITYSDLFSITMVIIGIISLIFTILTFTHKK